MNSINSTKKYTFLATILVAVFVFFFFGVAVNIARANTTGSILMNYDYDGGADPDCAWLLNNGSSIPWGDGKGSSSNPVSGQFNFCLNAAVRYASGLSDISNLDISYVKVAQASAKSLSNPGNGSSESDETYNTYRVSYAANIPATPTLTGSCSVSPTTVTAGNYIDWRASVSGGTGSYTYSWSGTDSLYGSSSSVSKYYSTAGTKTGTVTITSGSQSIVKSCTATVTEIPVATLSGSCSVSPSSVDIGDSVYWSSSVSGGTGSYTYSWSGTDSLVGSNSSISKIYSSAGTKTGTVTIVSGSQSIVKSCTATVSAVINPTLNGNIYVTPSNISVNNYLYWSASASGGTGSYTYSWSGTDSLYGSSSSVSKYYYTTGTKTGTVTITSGDQTITLTTSAVVTDDNNNNDDLYVYCSADDSSIDVDEDVTWTAHVSGGDGDYDYDWDGSDGLNDNDSSVTWSYDDDGTKTATVTVTDGDGETDSDSCTVEVEDEDNNNDDDLYVYCSADDSTIEVDEDVTWTAHVSGGDGDYDYDWDGSDGLNDDDSSVTWSYDDDGTKTATVTVEDDDGNTDSDSCTVEVEDEDNNDDDDDLSASCYANPSSPQVGSQMTWYVNVSGGDHDYDYDWSGTDGLNSSSESPHMTYNTPGTKTATVYIEDGDGQDISRTCYVSVNSVLAYTSTYQPPMASAVYLSQVPYTGLADNSKLAFFVVMLALFSAWIAYIIISYNKNKEEANS